MSDSKKQDRKIQEIVKHSLENMLVRTHLIHGTEAFGIANTKTIQTTVYQAKCGNCGVVGDRIEKTTPEIRATSFRSDAPLPLCDECKKVLS